VGYFSNGRVLLTPFDHPPLSRRALSAAQHDPKIALVWVEGLDHPERLPEIFRQLKTLGYRPISRTDFDQKSWSVIGLEKGAP